MPGQENKISQEQTQTAAGQAKEQAQYTPSVEPDFLREKIKQKPVNKKKLLRRTVITVVMAVVFGLVACFTFLILEPVISNNLYPEEEAKEVQFPEETASEEMKPEDMLVEEEVQQEEAAVTEEKETQQIEQILSQMEFGLDEYKNVYEQLAALANTASRAVVTVTGVSSDVDWFNDTYENEASASGVIVANNGRAMLILVSERALKEAESIEVTFCDQAKAEAAVIQRDSITGLAVLSVPLLSIGEDTMDVIDIAKLGSSNKADLLGSPVIALGSPLGTSGSISYGIVTSVGSYIDQPDSAYRMIMTDIYGGSSATGILIDLNGMVIGVIDSATRNSDMPNLLTAYGITELKKTIERLSNNRESGYLGVHGCDVPEEVARDMQIEIPAGAYIKNIEMDSPAMAAGIQSGDVVIAADGNEILSYAELLNVLNNSAPQDVLPLTISRQGREMEADVTLGNR